MGVGVLARVLDVKFMRWLNISLWKLIGAGLGGRGRWGSVTNFRLGVPPPTVTARRLRREKGRERSDFNG